MKTWIYGMMLGGALVFGSAGTSKAQFAVSVGNPWMGRGVYVGDPYLAPGYVYSSGYAGVVTPGIAAAPIVAGPTVVAAPAYGYSVYRPARVYRRGLWPFRRNVWY